MLQLLQRSGRSKQAERWSAIQLALTVLERDSRMIVDRPIIDGYGEQEPALIGGPQADYPLTLSRRSWSKPARPTPQRIATHTLCVGG